MAIRAKTDLETFLDYGVDEKNRKVYFGTTIGDAEEGELGNFTQASCDLCIRAIERMATDHPKTPIEIHMNSFGGDPLAMIALYDVIQAIECQIKFFGKGAIMSSATWIMAGSDERYLYPNTRILVHNGAASVPTRLTDLEIAVEEEKDFQDRLEQIYADNSRMPKQFWSEVCKRDLSMSAEEAIYLGLADKIIYPKKRGNYRKVRQHHLSQKIDKSKMNRLVKKLFKRVKINTTLEIIVNEPKIEPIDDRLQIVPMPEIVEVENVIKEDNSND